jgi:hypothetical protein
MAYAERRIVNQTKVPKYWNLQSYWNGILLKWNPGSSWLAGNLYSRRVYDLMLEEVETKDWKRICLAEKEVNLDSEKELFNQID